MLGENADFLRNFDGSSLSRSQPKKRSVGFFSWRSQSRSGRLRLIDIVRHGTACFVIGYFGIKLIMLLMLGPQTFETRIDRLSDGAAMEKATAFVFQADVATTYLAEQVRYVGLGLVRDLGSIVR